MRFANNRVAERLQIRYPIIQGPFGGGLSSTQLVATVSNAGGLGSFGAHHLPPAQIHELAREIRSLTPKPFALNLWVSDHDAGGDYLTEERFAQQLARLRPYFQELGLPEPTYPERFGQRFEEQVAALLAVKPPVFSFIFGIPDPAILQECRQQGIVTIGTATTLAEALALEEAGVDLMVVSGFEAGGHRASFLRPAEDSLMGTFALVPQVADQVKTPIIAAGGIADGRGIVAAMALGAQGVQIGTAFLACEESGTHARHRQMLFTDAARDTTLTRVFSGRLARSIRNRFSEEMKPFAQTVAPYPSQSWLTGQLRQAAIAQGRTDLIALWAGQATPLLRHHHAAELMQALVSEVEAFG
jgi:nitronate monooxygenase